MIWLSVNFDVFIKNLLRLWYEKILLLTSVNLWGDYQGADNALPQNSITTTVTTAAQWDWKRHALTVPLEAFVKLQLLAALLGQIL